MVPKPLIFLVCYLFIFANGEEHECQKPKEPNHKKNYETECVYKYQNQVLFKLLFEGYDDGTATVIKCNVQADGQQLQYIKNDPDLLPVDRSWISPELFIGKQKSKESKLFDRNTNLITFFFFYRNLLFSRGQKRGQLFLAVHQLFV